VHSSLWRHALLDNFRGLFEVTEGVYQVRGESLANVTFVEGDTGWIVIDPLTTVEVARYALDLLFEQVAERPIVAVIYSHSHSDHFDGVKGMVSGEDVSSGRVPVMAPRGFTEWVLKEQGRAAEGLPSRNAYLYGELLEPGPGGIVDTGLGQTIEGGTVTFIEPTDVIGPQGGARTIDGIEPQFLFAPGEDPTGMHCYAPKYRVLHVADNCYRCLHNVYTIRGAFPRDAMQWADSVARSLRFEDAEFLVSGHNWPVFGRDEVRRFLGEQRDAIEFMHDQTLRLMAHGFVPAEIAKAIEFPPALARPWHLRGDYGALEHNVRGIYAYYLGGYDGNPATLDRLPPRALARRTIDYMGGIESVVERAAADFERGEYRWVAHILDPVLWVEPEHRRARELAAAAHVQLGYGAENATWRNAYLTAAKELREGLRPGADVTVRVDRETLGELALGQIALSELHTRGVRFARDRSTLDRLSSLLDTLPAWFPVAPARPEARRAMSERPSLPRGRGLSLLEPADWTFRSPSVTGLDASRTSGSGSRTRSRASGSARATSARLPARHAPMLPG